MQVCVLTAAQKASEVLGWTERGKKEKGHNKEYLDKDIENKYIDEGVSDYLPSINGGGG
jgi:hypothetical protein